MHCTGIQPAVHSKDCHDDCQAAAAAACTTYCCPTRAPADVPMCQLLLEYSASISQQDVAGATPLIHAAARGATAAVQLLLDSKAGANLGRQWLLQQATTGGETALMAAAKGGHLDTVQVREYSLLYPHVIIEQRGLHLHFQFKLC
eukprot:GHRQ01031582.1.p1 GENE.GHRQ01031582.1~~GHRQ01031582.1.p1  ORF type:complete len:146 (-),score=20.11 GHRQ01031582.1:82-519(-)